jgi:hypothetical protein
MFLQTESITPSPKSISVDIPKRGGKEELPAVCDLARQVNSCTDIPPNDISPAFIFYSQHFVYIHTNSFNNCYFVNRHYVYLYIHILSTEILSTYTYIVYRHFVNRHFVYRHFVYRHFVYRHFVYRHFVYRHFVYRHLVNRHFDTRHFYQSASCLQNFTNQHFFDQHAMCVSTGISEMSENELP